MPICFVIQPFDNGKYDKRFNDVYKPAIEAAGYEAYRVDKDPSVSIPIESIESGIKEATLCLADITSDNPNVWYELGYAFASNTPVVMVCSDERPGKKYPFDIQHRNIIPYQADSPSDFEKLKHTITTKIKALIAKDNRLQKLSESTPIAPVEGLSQHELMVLAVIAGGSSSSSTTITFYEAKTDSERANITNIGFNLAIRKLTSKQLIEEVEELDENSGYSYNVLTVSNKGWQWIEENESRFVLLKPENNDNLEDDIPF
ncbi:hypothetical protein LG202_08600 [Methylobacillus methanolivorans]